MPDGLANARRYHGALPERIRQYLVEQRGIRDDLIDRHLLGWNGLRITVPIFDRQGNFGFFKLAKDPVDKRGSPKMLASPGARAELYGWERVKQEPHEIIICEGEFDRLVLESHGFPAVTSTAGARVFRKEWAVALRVVPEVFVCFDRDEAGRHGALNVARLVPKAKVIEVPEEVGEGGDVTDFFVRLQAGRAEFLALMERAKPVLPEILEAAKKPVNRPFSGPGGHSDSQIREVKRGGYPSRTFVARYVTLIDEGDFRFSDEKAEIVKILNNGNARGFPVLRSESIGQREFSPRAYEVFGPKIVATRSYFQDRALESRCLTEEMGRNRLRDDIPINLTDAYREDALVLRNKLLMFRFRSLGKHQVDASLVDRSIEPRLAQVFVPVMSIIENDDARQALRQLARDYDRALVDERGAGVEAQVLGVIQELRAEGQDLAIKEITNRFIASHGEDYHRKITPHWIGQVIRRKLGLRTEKRHGSYAVASREGAKVTQLLEKYGINSGPNDFVHSGDLLQGTEDNAGAKEQLSF